MIRRDGAAGMVILSWAWSAVAGIASVIFLTIALGGVIATTLAVIGIFRGRCRWYAVVMYLCCVAIGSFLFRGVFWISEEIAQPDTISTGLFWANAAVCAIEALSISPKLIAQVWQLTNTPKHPAGIPT